MAPANSPCLQPPTRFEGSQDTQHLGLLCCVGAGLMCSGLAYPLSVIQRGAQPGCCTSNPISALPSHEGLTWSLLAPRQAPDLHLPATSSTRTRTNPTHTHPFPVSSPTPSLPASLCWLVCAGQYGYGLQSAYCSSKGALVPLAKSLALAWWVVGWDVCGCVCRGGYVGEELCGEGMCRGEDVGEELCRGGDVQGQPSVSGVCMRLVVCVCVGS